jgi:hypothetical protein
VQFFSPSDGIVFGCANTRTAPVTVWATEDGGRHWTSRMVAIG